MLIGGHVVQVVGRPARMMACTTQMRPMTLPCRYGATLCEPKVRTLDCYLLSLCSVACKAMPSPIMSCILLCLHLKKLLQHCFMRVITHRMASMQAVVLDCLCIVVRIVNQSWQ